MKAINNNNAISPATGIIIMVPTIIILTAIIMSWGTGITGHLSKHIVFAFTSVRLIRFNDLL
ncbi:MAG: flagellin (archaellin), FlaG/FlaF family [Candidatus Methanocomedens sp.]|nr:MAG: flagellin (archaellin), FlaG/FlaF family [ANME-2 cluster archaeon]